MDELTEGWLAAKQLHESGVNVLTHYSQGDRDWDEGWNQYIDEQLVKTPLIWAENRSTCVYTRH